MRVIDAALHRHAAARPDAVALLTPSGAVSYRQLDRRVDRLARVLLGRGVTAEQVCVVALEPGADAVVATAAVLRAGGAFLAVDVDQPAARLAALVRSGGGGLVLTHSRLLGRVPLPGPAVLVDGPGAPDPAPAPPPVVPAQLAYVSHTSGSTGAPNPVLIEHRGLDSYLAAMVREHDLTPDTTALQLAPPGYDASVRDTFAPLVAGGRLVLAPRSALLRADEFVGLIGRYGVDTLLSVTPSFLTFLAGHPDPARHLRGLRLTAVSGESLRPFLAAGGRALLGGRLVNQYGPTECTMTSTRFEVAAEPETGSDLIGTPLAGVTVHLLDPDLRPVTEGTVGEVHIGGAGVARGYGGRSGLTADRFVPDPAGPPGARVYRTGDLARRRPDGVLEYLGRQDRQVKIRGHRVDPAEVEGALLAHPAVSGAVVTAATDDRGRVHLVAHVTGVPADVPDRALRDHLARTLPPHLMPRRFLRTGRLPTTRSGKVDRTALAAAGAVS